MMTFLLGLRLEVEDVDVSSGVMQLSCGESVRVPDAAQRFQVVFLS